MQETTLHRIKIERHMLKGESIDLCSHFDLFPVGKYRDYCSVTSFRCDVDSDAQVVLETLLYDSECRCTVSSCTFET